MVAYPTTYLTANDDLIFCSAMDAVIVEVANAQQCTVLKARVSARRRTLLSTDLEVYFKLNIVSDETNVQMVTDRITEELEVAFIGTTAQPETPFGAAMDSAAASLSLANVGLVDQDKSAITLAGGLNVTVLPSDVFTAFPTESPTFFPTPEPSVASFGVISKEAVQVVATVTAVAVGGSVAVAVTSSVTSSVAGATTTGVVGGGGASGGGAAAGGGGGGSSGSASGGDPFSLIFLAQGIATTKSIATMPATYTDDFAGQFAIFNMQMKPPKWARSVVDWQLKGVFDTSEASMQWRNHFFYLVSIFFGTVAVHLLYIKISQHYSLFIPEVLEFPRVECAALIALYTGMIDSGVGLIAKEAPAAGYRVLALIEIMAGIAMVYFFYMRGVQFKKHHIWVPYANIRRIFKGKSTTNIDELQLTKIDEGEETLTKEFTKTHMPFEHASFLEQACAIMFMSRRQAGYYELISSGSDESEQRPQSFGIDVTG